MLKVKDILERPHNRIIAMNKEDDHILFDTFINTEKRIERFHDFVVVSLWGDVRTEYNSGLAHWVCPYLAMYIRPKEAYDDEPIH